MQKVARRVSVVSNLPDTREKEGRRGHSVHKTAGNVWGEPRTGKGLHLSVTHDHTFRNRKKVAGETIQNYPTRGQHSLGPEVEAEA